MMAPIFENVPDELKKCRQWVVWRSVICEESGKPTKPPFMPSGKLAKSDDPSSWSHFLTVKAAADQFDGIGFVLTKDDPFVGLDFDNCRCPALDALDPETAGGLDMVLPEIADHIRSLNTYTEVSPSGKGIRVFAKGRLPLDGKRKGRIEVYQSGRYVTVTGRTLDGLPRNIESRQLEIDAFYQTVFGTTEEPPKQEKNTRAESAPGEWRVMIEKAFESKSGPEIRRLWNGDFSAYPSQSEGDMALCSHLAFWLGCDAAKLDSAFRESGRRPVFMTCDRVMSASTDSPASRRCWASDREFAGTWVCSGLNDCCCIVLKRRNGYAGSDAGSPQNEIAQDDQNPAKV